MSELTAAGLLKQAKRLKRKVERERLGLFIAEGRQIIEAAISSKANLIGIFVSSDQEPFLPELKVPIFKISAKEFQEITDTVTPQGILAIVRNPGYSLESIPEDPKTLIYLEGIQDPGNLGTIIRTADAFGASAVLLSPGSVDPFNEKCVRSSAGSVFNLPVITGIDLYALEKLKRTNDAELVATSLDATTYVAKIDIKSIKNLIWAIGNEANGITPELRKISTKLVKIPMLGKAESLNAAVAAAVCLYASATQNLQEEV